MIEFLTTLGLGLSLAADAFAVSVTNGLCYKDMKTATRIGMAASFGFFQGLMPTLGFFLGSLFAEKIEFIDHWIAFVLLAGIGINMIIEAIKERKETKENPQACCSLKKKLTLGSVLVQSVATSIDAFAVGIGLALAGSDILSSAFTIAVVTFLCCIAGVYIGKAAGGALKDKAQFAGGAVLIIIGLKILIEHLFFS
jgi:putative Mn2+ efflux pump MntP